MAIVKCGNCKKEFKQRFNREVCCSRPCSNEYRKSSKNRKSPEKDQTSDPNVQMINRFLLMPVNGR